MKPNFSNWKKNNEIFCSIRNETMESCTASNTKNASKNSFGMQKNRRHKYDIDTQFIDSPCDFQLPRMFNAIPKSILKNQSSTQVNIQKTSMKLDSIVLTKPNYRQRDCTCTSFKQNTRSVNRRCTGKITVDDYRRRRAKWSTQATSNHMLNSTVKTPSCFGAQHVTSISISNKNVVSSSHKMVSIPIKTVRFNLTRNDKKNDKKAIGTIEHGEVIEITPSEDETAVKNCKKFIDEKTTDENKMKLKTNTKSVDPSKNQNKKMYHCDTCNRDTIWSNKNKHLETERHLQNVCFKRLCNTQ